MRVLFFGTPEFSKEVLEYLIKEKVDIVGVISRPDMPKGRSLVMTPQPIKEVALLYNIPIFQPEKVSDPSFLETLKEFNADLFVVVAYGEILRQHVLDLPRRGCINLHASLLPAYRGAAPIQHAIINGDKVSGITIMHMVRKMDAGNIISQVKVDVPLEMTYGELQDLLSEVGKKELLEVIKKIEIEPLPGIPQEELKVTFAPKIELENCQIDFKAPLMKIHNLIRGVSPEPSAWCQIELKASDKSERKRLKIFKSYPHFDKKVPPNELLLDNNKRVLIGHSEGSLELLEVQLEGKKRMRAYDFYQGIAKNKVFAL